MRAIIFAAAAGAVLLGQVGCALTDVDLGDSATRQMLSLLMPAEIIVEPFTGLKSFDDDDLPDGIQVVMRPVDAFGDPVKIAGHLIIEVHEFRPASGERQGREIEQWDIELASTRDQQKYWNRVTQMYEIPLALGPEAMDMEAGKKFVIGITYNTPLGEHMITEHVFEPPLQTETGLAGQ